MIQKSLLALMICGAGISGMSAALPHRGEDTAQTQPMVVEGRSWEYVAETHLFGMRFLEKFVLKVEGETAIDGQGYAIVNAYVADQPNPVQDKPYCYLRETTDGQVYALTNPEYEYEAGQADPVEGMEFLSDGAEFLLVDFNDFYASRTFSPMLYYGEEKCPYETYTYTNTANSLKVWQLEPQYGEIRMVEKVGYVLPDEPCSLLSPMYVASTGDNHEQWLYLQQVYEADGTIIYQIENMYSSEISVAADESPAEYFDLQGRKLNPDALRPGICISRRGGVSSKVIIR